MPAAWISLAAMRVVLCNNTHCFHERSTAPAGGCPAAGGVSEPPMSMCTGAAVTGTAAEKVTPGGRSMISERNKAGREFLNELVDGCSVWMSIKRWGSRS